MDYNSLFGNIYQFSPNALISLFMLCLFRLAPIVALAPFLGAKLPAPIKMGLMVSLSLILIPFMAVTSTTSLAFTPAIIGYAAKEFLIGFILAFFVCVPFQIAQSAGILIDFIRGSSSLQVSDPFSQAQTSPIGNLYNYVLIVIFYTIGGPFFLLESILASYKVVPVDSFLPAFFFSSIEIPFWKISLAVVGQVFALAIQLSAPALLAVLMTEVFLGIANRLAPQVQIVFLGMSLKSLIGLAILCAGWFFILEQLEHQTLLWMEKIHQMVLQLPS